MCGLKLNTLNVRHWIFDPKFFIQKLQIVSFTFLSMAEKLKFENEANISNPGLRLKVLVITIQMLNALLNISVVACLPNIASPLRAISGWWILVTVCNYTQLSFLQTVRWKVSAIKNKLVKRNYKLKRVKCWQCHINIFRSLSKWTLQYDVWGICRVLLVLS